MGSEIGSVHGTGASLRLAQAYGVVSPRSPGVVATAFPRVLPGIQDGNVPLDGPGTTQARARDVVDTLSLAVSPQRGAVDPAKAASLRAEIGRTLSAAKLEVGIEPSTGMPLARAEASTGTGASGVNLTGSGFTSATASQGVLPRTPATVLAMYQKPADQNVAATGVALGRQLDLNG